MLDRVVIEHGLPGEIRVGNGSEFTSKALDLWAYANEVELDFGHLEKPGDNAYIESFNSLLRKECLNQHWFLSLEDAITKTEDWRVEYNEERPNGSLRNLMSKQFARKRHYPKMGGSQKSNP